MSKIEELIQQLCPNGVEYKPLNSLGNFYCGLTGKNKEDFISGNAKFITYKNIYSNIALNINTDERVKIEEKEQQNTIEYGDVLFTGSSETPDECGFSSVLTTKTDEKLYLNSFCFGFRLFDKNLFLPDFLKHIFRSQSLRYQIGKTASGVTRFNVSKKLMGKIIIPVPPLPVQEEIVRILDNFTNLTAELQAELQARKSQYEYYRDELLNYNCDKSGSSSLQSEESLSSHNDGNNASNQIHKLNSQTDKSVLQPNVKWMKLGEIAKFRNGKGHETDIVDSGKFIVVNSKFISTNGIVKKYSDKQIVPLFINDILMVMSDLPNGRALAKCFIVDQNDKYTLNQRIGAFSIKNASEVNNRFLYYILNRNRQLTKYDNGVDQTNLRKDNILDILIPIPPLSEQERIVKILDRFDALVNDISNGLPAEIAARQKQYEYYRDMLLSFNELPNE